MRQHRLLTRGRGSATIEIIGSILLLMMLTLGAVQVGLTLYARNIVVAAIHDGTRAGLELGRTPEEAAAIAVSTIRNATGDLTRDVRVSSGTFASDGEFTVYAEIEGSLVAPGPIPVSIPLHARASSTRAALPR